MKVTAIVALFAAAVVASPIPEPEAEPKVITFSNPFFTETVTIPDFPKPTFPSIPIPSFPSIPKPTFPSFPQPTFPSFPTPSFPSFPTPTFPPIKRAETEAEA